MQAARDQVLLTWLYADAVVADDPRGVAAQRCNWFMRELHQTGWTQKAIADVVGITGQAVSLRIKLASAAADPSALTYQPGLSITGASLSALPSPPAALSPSAIAKLRRLHARARTVVGGTPKNDPRRQASHQLSAEINRLLASGVRLTDIANALEVSPGSVSNRLVRHGYRQRGPAK